MKAFAVAISGLLLAAPALAQPTDNTNRNDESSTDATGTGGNSTSPETDENGERRICRKVETNTGSRVPWRRVCLTERQWRTYNRQN